MCKRVSRWGSAAAAVALVVGLLSAAWAVEGQDEQTLGVFRQGVRYYQAGEYGKAKEAFDEVLALNPGMPTALQMRESAEVGLFIDMKANGQLGEQADELLDLMWRAQRESKRTVEKPDQLVRDFQSTDMETYARARVALLGHGPYAVPYLVPLLAGADPKDPQQTTAAGRAVALLAITEPDACLPLIQVLEGSDNSLLKRRVAGVLGQIGDARAVPALLAAAADQDALLPTRKAAAEALRMITDTALEELGTVAAQYLDLGTAYFAGDSQRVGYTYGTTANIWQWDADAVDLVQKVVCEQVPHYLYFQRMASEVALAGLAVEPANADLLALLAASQVRQLALAEFFKSAETRFGGAAVADDVKQDAAGRAAEFEVEVPVVLRMLPAPVVGRALVVTLGAADGPASLYLVNTLRAKLAAAGPAAPDEETVGALVAAMNSGDRDVRYNAAIALVASCPTGEGGPADQIMAVLNAALSAAADRNALVLVDDLQVRNELVVVLRGEGVATTETRVDPGLAEAVLSLQPSVDIVFVSANVRESLFAGAMEKLQSDPRTKAAPLYVVSDPTKAGADLADWGGIEQVLSTDHIRSAVLQPVLQEKVFAKSRSAFTREEEATVLTAAAALGAVQPLNTQYDLSLVQPSLIKALTGYSEDVSRAAIARLTAFGSAASVEPLAALVAGEGATSLKIAACNAAAAVLKRVEDGPSEKVVQILKDALAGDVQDLSEAAAEALSAAGLSESDVLTLLCTEGLGRQ